MLTAGNGAAGQLGDGAAGSSGGVKSHLTSCGRRADGFDVLLMFHMLVTEPSDVRTPP